MDSCVASARESVPAILPSRTTMIRSLTPRISVSSEETIKIQMPDADSDEVVPLTSGESKDVICEEYKVTSKCRGGVVEVPKEAMSA